MANRHIPDSELLRQIRAARRRDARARAAGRRAVAAEYDPRTGRVLIELTSGYFLGFPATSIPSLVNATPEQLAEVELSPGGGGLHWESLDADLSVPGLILSFLGRAEKLSELARLAGQAKSNAKAAAARANGAKGGRPRKTAKA